MEHGDLSSEVPSRVVAIFERLIMTVPEKYEARFARNMSKRKYTSALACVRLDEDVVNVMRGWAWTKPYRIDVMSHLSDDPDYRAALEEFTRLEEIPAQLVHARPQQAAASMLRRLPDVAVVFHRDAHPFVYGSLGYVVTDAATMRMAI